MVCGLQNPLIGGRRSSCSPKLSAKPQALWRPTFLHNSPRGPVKSPTGLLNTRKHMEIFPSRSPEAGVKAMVLVIKPVATHKRIATASSDPTYGTGGASERIAPANPAWSLGIEDRVHRAEYGVGPCVVGNAHKLE